MASKSAGATPPTTAGWDVESRMELASESEGHIKDGVMYAIALLWTQMKNSWGGMVTHIKTKTAPVAGEVRICKADVTDEGAVRVRKSKSQNAAEFSFVRPLKKLGITIPKDRMFKVTPYTEQMDGVGTVWVYPVSGVESVPRKARAAAAAAKAEQ